MLGCHRIWSGEGQKSRYGILGPRLGYARTGAYDRAIADYDQVLQLNPNLAAVYHGRGWVFAKKGHHDRAIEEYSHALQLKPTLEDALRERGIAYTNKNDYVRAMHNLVPCAAKFNTSRKRRYFGCFFTGMLFS